MAGPALDSAAAVGLARAALQLVLPLPVVGLPLRLPVLLVRPRLAVVDPGADGDRWP